MCSVRRNLGVTANELIVINRLSIVRAPTEVVIIFSALHLSLIVYWAPERQLASGGKAPPVEIINFGLDLG